MPLVKNESLCFTKEKHNKHANGERRALPRVMIRIHEQEHIEWTMCSRVVQSHFRHREHKPNKPTKELKSWTSLAMNIETRQMGQQLTTLFGKGAMIELIT